MRDCLRLEFLTVAFDVVRSNVRRGARAQPKAMGYRIGRTSTRTAADFRGASFRSARLDGQSCRNPARCGAHPVLHGDDIVADDWISALTVYAGCGSGVWADDGGWLGGRVRDSRDYR